MSDYKTLSGHWPRSPFTIVLFILLFEVACYFLLLPVLELLKLS